MRVETKLYDAADVRRRAAKVTEMTGESDRQSSEVRMGGIGENRGRAYLVECLYVATSVINRRRSTPKDRW